MNLKFPFEVGTLQLLDFDCSPLRVFLPNCHHLPYLLDLSHYSGDVHLDIDTFLGRWFQQQTV